MSIESVPRCPECGGTMLSAGASHLQGRLWAGPIELSVNSLRCDRMDPDPCDGALELVRGPSRYAGALFTIDGDAIRAALAEVTA